jgi:hypothetical protein
MGIISNHKWASKPHPQQALDFSPTLKSFIIVDYENRYRLETGKKGKTDSLVIPNKPPSS